MLVVRLFIQVVTQFIQVSVCLLRFFYTGGQAVTGYQAVIIGGQAVYSGCLYRLSGSILRLLIQVVRVFTQDLCTCGQPFFYR